MSHFDFDDWCDLARFDREQFELRRAQWIERAIEKGGNSARLRGLQWRIDEERRLSKTPLKSCLKIYSLMWDALLLQRDMLSAQPTTDLALDKPSHISNIADFQKLTH